MSIIERTLSDETVTPDIIEQRVSTLTSALSLIPELKSSLQDILEQAVLSDQWTDYFEQRYSTTPQWKPYYSIDENRNSGEGLEEKRQELMELFHTPSAVSCALKQIGGLAMETILESFDDPDLYYAQYSYIQAILSLPWSVKDRITLQGTIEALPDPLLYDWIARSLHDPRYGNNPTRTVQLLGPLWMVFSNEVDQEMMYSLVEHLAVQTLKEAVDYQYSNTINHKKLLLGLFEVFGIERGYHTHDTILKKLQIFYAERSEGENKPYIKKILSLMVLYAKSGVQSLEEIMSLAENQCLEQTQKYISTDKVDFETLCKHASETLNRISLTGNYTIHINDLESTYLNQAQYCGVAMLLTQAAIKYGQLEILADLLHTHRLECMNRDAKGNVEFEVLTSLASLPTLPRTVREKYFTYFLTASDLFDKHYAKPLIAAINSGNVAFFEAYIEHLDATGVERNKREYTKEENLGKVSILHLIAEAPVGTDCIRFIDALGDADYIKTTFGSSRHSRIYYRTPVPAVVTMLVHGHREGYNYLRKIMEGEFIRYGERVNYLMTSQRVSLEDVAFAIDQFDEHTPEKDLSETYLQQRLVMSANGGNLHTVRYLLERYGYHLVIQGAEVLKKYYIPIMRISKQCPPHTQWYTEEQLKIIKDNQPEIVRLLREDDQRHNKLYEKELSQEDIDRILEMISRTNTP